MVADSHPTTGSETGLQTLLVGIDAASRDVLEPLFRDDVVPTLESIFADGVAADLESQVPPWTPSAWPSLYTGTNPGKHGVFDFLRFDGYDWDVVDRSRVREHALWELASEHGRSSVVVNVPVTHPPCEFDGALVPGYVAPEDPECHPSGLLADIRDVIGDYTVYAPGALADRTRDETVEGYRELVGMRRAAFEYLVDRFDPDFGFVQFQATDTVFHELPGDDEAVRATYAAVDEQLQSIVETCNPQTVVVVSDHGIGEYEGHGVRVNEFLRDRGYVETVRGGSSMPSWSSVVRNQLMTGEADAGTAPSVMERALTVAAKFGITSQRLGRVLAAVGLDDIAHEYVPADVIRAGAEQVSFAESTAFMRSRTECGVRINLAGREPDGEVPPGEYEPVRDELVEAFRSLRTPDGDPVFDTVAPREAFFEGPHVEDAADVILVPADYDHYLSAILRGDTFGEPWQPYNHKRHGIVAARGEAVDPSATPTDAHLFDVAPTVLASMDLPPSERMDGDVLPFVDPVEPEPYPAFEVESVSTGTEQDVEQRLRDVGYIE